MSQVIDANIRGNSRVFFVRGDRTAIVDTGNPGSHRDILRALKNGGISREQVSVIIITHAHIDHCGSVRELKAELKVPVMAGWPDADFLEKGENIPVASLSGNMASARAAGPNYGWVKADVIVNEDMSLRGYGIDALVLTTPGHTIGSLSVLASNGDCATGDFLAGLYTAAPDLIVQSLEKMARGGAKYFYPSHAARIDAATVLNGLSSL